jgi:cysteine desulfurase
VQAAGKFALDFTRLGVDYLALSAHKLGGPQGVGALIAAEAAPLQARQKGGGQERGLRAGTENVPGIAGFGAAAAAARRELGQFARLAAWRDRLEAALRALSPQSRFFGAEVERLPNTACFTMPGVPSETQVIALDLAGIAVSAGAACSSGKVRPSHVLRAMGADDAAAGSAIRVSLGWLSEEAHIDRLVAAWGELASRVGAHKAA